MRRCHKALLLGCLLLLPPAVVAAPLDKAGCDKLKAEQTELEQQGVRAAMANGPQWAKANLKPEQLDQIRHIIDVDGQLLFRCNGRPLVTLPKDVETDPAQSEVGEKSKEEAKERSKEGPKEGPREGLGVKRETDANTPASEKSSPAAQAKAAAGKKAPLADGKRRASVNKAVTGLPAKPAHETSGTAARELPASKQKAKAKPRVDDAYKPPPAEPTANPFANQVNQLLPGEEN
jgi:hypothetical protein